MKTLGEKRFFFLCLGRSKFSSAFLIESAIQVNQSTFLQILRPCTFILFLQPRSRVSLSCPRLSLWGAGERDPGNEVAISSDLIFGGIRRAHASDVLSVVNLPVGVILFLQKCTIVNFKLGHLNCSSWTPVGAWLAVS